MKLGSYAVATTVLLCTSLVLAESGTQRTFDSLKALEGTWEGKNSQGQSLEVTFRDTAGGSALLSEIHVTGKEDMVSMIHRDGDRLLMTHYCGAGNQPRMKATLASDGKSVSFDFVDGTNLAGPEAGHMSHVVFSMLDADHHNEEWVFVDHGKPMTEMFTLHRTN